MGFPVNAPTLPKARVLVVDDHPSTATMLARAISQSAEGIEVVSATSGAMALERVRDDAVDLVITDMMMPNMNGLQLIEKLQSQPGGRPAYTVLITGYDIPGLKETARRLKVNETIIKPIRPERICQIVRRVVEELQRAEPLDRPARPQQPFKILVADDIPDNVSLIARYLINEGYTYIAATDGADALEKARSEFPDLILLDVNMPEKDGFEVLREIRSDPALQNMAVIMLTAARPDPSDMQYGLNLGADDYVVKPFDRRELLARIRTKLRAKEADDAIRRRYGEVRVLPEIGRDLSGRLDIEELAEIALRRTVETFGAMYGHIIIMSSEGRFEKTYRVADSLEPTTVTPSFELLTHHIEETHQSLIIDNVRKDSRWNAPQDDLVRSAVLVPLIGRLDLIGFMVLTHEKVSYFKPDDLLLMQAIAGQAAIAIESARLHLNTIREFQLSASILRSMADAILVFNEYGNLQTINPAGAKLFADHPPKAGDRLDTGMGCKELFEMLNDALSSQQPTTREISWPDGRTYLTCMTSLQEGGWVASLHELTHQNGLLHEKNDSVRSAFLRLDSLILEVSDSVQLLQNTGRLNLKQLGHLHEINTKSIGIKNVVQNQLDQMRAGDH